MLSKVLQNCVPYTSLLNDINGGYLPVSASGLSNVHKALISTALVRDTGKKIVVITPDEASAVFNE